MKYQKDHLVVMLLILADLVCLNLVAGLAIYVRFYTDLLPYPDAQPPWSSLLAFLGVSHLALFPSLIFAGAYRVPRRWQSNETFPVVTKALLLTLPVTTALLFTLRFGVTQSGLVLTPSRFVAFSVWTGLFVGLVGVRLLAGRLQLTLYRRGVGLLQVVIVGDGAEADQVAERIQQNSWLGEQVLGRIGYNPGPDWLGSPEDLAAVVQRYHVDVVWLAPHANAALWLPSLLFDPDGSHLTWRMLPEHFDRFIAMGSLSNLTLSQQDLFYDRLQHDLALPTLRIAMLGSRGVPASYGGVEKYVEEVGSYLAAGGAQVAVYCHARYVSVRGEYRGMKLRFVPSIHTKHLETIIHTFLATLHALLHEEEIFHYQALGPSTLAWLPRLFGRKVVVTVHGLDWQRAKWGRIAQLYLKFGEWAAAYFPHRTIVVSQTLAHYYAERYGKSTSYIPNGLEPPMHKASNLISKLGLNKDGYILFVGRLVPEKGCHTLLRAFASVQTDKQLVIAGSAIHEDRYYQKLEEEARSLSRVRFIGFVQGDMLRELYSNAYLVVHPSEIEGLSISLLEALSYGNCLLVSNTPENLEVVKSAGYSFQAYDSVDLARQLQWLLDRPDQVEAMRARARSQASTLMDWDTVAEMTRVVYESLVCRSPR